MLSDNEKANLCSVSLFVFEQDTKKTVSVYTKHIQTEDRSQTDVSCLPEMIFPRTIRGEAANFKCQRHWLISTNATDSVRLSRRQAF